MQKIIYISQTSLFNDWAHTVQILKMCEAFADNQTEVTLLISKRGVKGSADPFKYYGIKNCFKIVYLPILDLLPGNKSVIFYFLRFISFLISARIYLLLHPYDVLYTRDIYHIPWFNNVYLELHTFPKKLSFLKRQVMSRASGIVVLTSFIRSKIIDSKVCSKVLVAHDAVRLEDFSDSMSVKAARKQLGIPQDIKVYGYVGTLKTMGMEKGVGCALLALRYLPQNYRLFVVGGEAHDIDYYKEYAAKEGVTERVIFAGKIPHKDVSLYISACDVVVAPFPRNEHYSYYMSPLKIFEYMASQRPIIVTSLPSLQEVLVPNETALFIEPDDSQALAEHIVRLVEDKELASRISSNALREVTAKYTWKQRARGIMEFLQS